jgi:hypothetical protein
MNNRTTDQLPPTPKNATNGAQHTMPLAATRGEKTGSDRVNVIKPPTLTTAAANTVNGSAS